MSKTIFFFVKFFENSNYANDFLDGRLFLNRLSYFKKIEENEAVNRGDKFEGVVGWHQPDKIKLRINDFEIKELAGPVSIQMNHLENLHIFCLYAAHSGELHSVSHESLPELKKQLLISHDCKKLGGNSVIITKSQEFINRVVGAISKNEYIGSAKLVQYYDPNIFSGEFTENDAVFKKRNEFAYQSEYRFAINTGFNGEDSLILNIGPIRDIAHFCDIEEINSSLTLTLPKKNA